MMIKAPKLAKAHEESLRSQVFNAEQPGPILHDFQMLLDFLESEGGLETRGKNSLLPLSSIAELDSRLSRPLQLQLKRPQLRSHPYLQGLNVLLRASALGRVEARGPKARLVVDPEMLLQWNRLNPTEQYFNLLEAWLRFGNPRIVGEEGGGWDGPFERCLAVWEALPDRGRRYGRQVDNIYVYRVGRNLHILAMLDLFALLSIETPPGPLIAWRPSAIRHTPFGDAVFSLIASLLEVLGTEGISEPLDQDTEPAGLHEPQLGALQPLLQPYFPEWHENLQFPVHEPREGTFVFRVSLGDVWRLIAMPDRASLDDFMSVILRSVKFDDDQHLYEFLYRDYRSCEVSVCHPEAGEGIPADEVCIGELPLEPGQTMDLTFDFGQDWEFRIELIRIEPSSGKAKRPRILETHGKAPEQYPTADW